MRTHQGRIGLLFLWLAGVILAFPGSGLGGSVVATANSAESAQVRKVLARLQERYRKTSSFSAAFHEEITAGSGAKRVRDGKVYYAKPGRMRWDFNPPDNETIVSDGTTLYNFQPDLNQVIEAPLKSAFTSSAAAALLVGTGDLLHDFNPSAPASAPDESLVQLTLTPKSGGQIVLLGLNPATYQIEWLQLSDQIGNVTTVRFSEIRSNEKLDDGLFRFQVPPSADIVTMPMTPH